MKLVALLALAVCAAACTADETPSRPADVKLPPYVQEMHPGSLAAGAVVIERSGEFNLVNSAIAAIDGSADVAWWSPPRSPEQWLILRLPGEVRLDAVNLIRHAVDETAPSIMVEASSDGRAWSELGIARMKEGTPVSSVAAGGVPASLLRVTMLEGVESKPFSALPDLVVDGAIIRPAPPVSWSGDWRVNQRTLSLRAENGMVTGEVPFLRTTMKLIGRPRGGFLPFAWSKGNVVGYGALSLSAQGELNGMWYWEFPFTWRLAETWFGRREEAAASPAVDRRELALDFLREGHPSPFYEISFREAALEQNETVSGGIELLRDIIASNPQARFRVSVWDTIGAGLAAARLAALESAMRADGELPPNVVFAVKAGNLLDQPPRNPVTRALFDRIDLEAAPAEGGSAAPIVLR